MPPPCLLSSVSCLLPLLLCASAPLRDKLFQFLFFFVPRLRRSRNLERSEISSVVPIYRERTSGPICQDHFLSGIIPEFIGMVNFFPLFPLRDLCGKTFFTFFPFSLSIIPEIRDQTLFSLNLPVLLCTKKIRVNLHKSV